jgi:pyrroloquinoline quinone biosynthesis protein B
MIVRVLGSAAGGGVPQWNCACENCEAARSARVPRRTQSGLAMSHDGISWILLNCSPDIAMQIEAFRPLLPSRDRRSPITDVLLTDANLDHVGGLAILRQATHPIRVRSSAVISRIARSQPSFAQFAVPPHRWIDVPLDGACSKTGDDDPVGRLFTVRAIVVPGSTPAYDGRRAERGAVVAYEISEDGKENVLLFAPIFAAISELLRDAIARAKVAFLDGSFYRDDELEATVKIGKTARSMGHQIVSGPCGTLAQLPRTRGRLIFTHINNTNPMLDPDSRAAASVRGAGAEVAYDGMEVTL